MQSNIYFDYAATTPIEEEVLQEMQRVARNCFGNPSSIHAFGREAKKVLEDARRTLAESLGVEAKEIFFTSGGTEANNTAIFQIAKAQEHLGKHIITTAIEHHSVSYPMRELERLGFEVSVLSVNETGEISLEEFQRLLRPDTILVSVMAVNNEMGAMLPIQELGEILHDAQHVAKFHVDAVQALAYFEIFPKEFHIHLLTGSAHKMEGPRGIGFLFVEGKTHFLPLFLGGTQEGKKRAGTENLPAIAGFAKAVALHSPLKKREWLIQLENRKKILLENLAKSGISFAINGNESNLAPHILNLHFPHVSKHLLLMRLDLMHIAVSIGSACTAGTVEDSDVLVAMFGKENPKVKESIRISFGKQTTEEEVRTLSETLVQIVREMQEKAGVL